MIAEAGHYALVLALGLALIQSSVPMLGARWGDPALMNVARSTALAQLLFVAASFAALVALYVAFGCSSEEHHRRPLPLQFWHSRRAARRSPKRLTGSQRHS